MASRWQGLGASKRWRFRQDQEQPGESEALQPGESNVLQPAVSHPETSRALGSLCKQLQRRLPLGTVSLNLGAGPSWKRLEIPEPGQQGLQAAARSAKSALGAMSQRIQESCQSSTKWLVETQVKARTGKRGPQKASSTPPGSRSQKSTRLSGAAPARSALGPWERKSHSLSVQMNLRAHPQRRSRREAAFWSPCSSTEPLCSPSESDSDLEPVGAGIQHLQKLSHELDEVIVAEESGNSTVFLLRD
ncbi:protein PIMREG isoform X2 [Tamandua tetradactyla]|uniref:protein PIMREG isoform X2 n=1 Tax=Tamandua tetradactyla TaxID=48850 RepID=UPI0040539A4F